MSDRLALANAMASVIFDVIHELKADIAGVRSDLLLVEHRLLTRLGGLVVVVAGVLFAALWHWPPG